MYQRVGNAAYKKDLNNTLALCEALGNPQHKFKSIHVAGTNGKGSVSHMLASIFQENGYTTGLYTSPHLLDFRERIKINGETVSEEFVIQFVKQIKPHLEAIKPSFFEITVAMAFHYFAESKVDIAIIETGLGGRLDSTNVINPELSVITNIGMDHTDMLGTTLTAIAGEKAGIIKPNVACVIGEMHPETKPVFDKKAAEVGAPISYAQELITSEEVWPSDLVGDYQKANIRTVMASVKVLSQTDWKLDAAKEAVMHVVQNTGLLGRWQTIQSNPKVVCDTGHNKDGLQYIVKQLAKQEYKTLHIVFGQVVGKDTSETLEILPKQAVYYFCKPSVIRGLSEVELANSAKAIGLKGEAYQTVKEAYQSALEIADDEDFVFVGGSTFVVADLLTYLEDRKQA